MDTIRNFFTKIKNIILKGNLKPLLPYFIAVLSGITTYFLYSYFNRDIVTVQSAVIRPKEIVLKIDRQLANRINKALSVRNFFNFDDGIDRTIMDKNSVFDILKILKKNSEDLSDELINKRNAINILNETIGDSISTDQMNKIKELIKYKEDYVEENFLLNNFGKEIKLNKNNLISAINNNIEKDKTNKQEIDDIIKLLSAKTKKNIEENKDKFQIEIIAYNEGNQQTVIRHKGILLLGTTTVNLKKVSKIETEKFSKSTTDKLQGNESSSNYLIVQPKSYALLNLEIEDDFNNNDRDIQVMKRAYLLGQSTVELKLFNIMNKEIKPFYFRLQSDLEYNPNDELLKYINPFLE